MINIVWTSNARDAYLATLEYLLNNYTSEVAISFDDKVENLIQNLGRYQFFCPPSLEFNNLRRCTISRYNSLVYSVKKDVITIIAFFDNRSEFSF